MTNWLNKGWGVLPLIWVLGSANCFWVTTKHEGKQMRAQISTLDQRLTEQERLLSDKLENLAGNSAELGADLQSLNDEMRKLRGLITTTKHDAAQLREQLKASTAITKRITALEGKLAEFEEQLKHVAAEANRKSPKELWSIGKAAYDERRYRDAEKHFQQLVSLYPNAPEAPNAQYYRAESKFQQKQYADSIGHFQRVFDIYKKSARAPQAMYRAGEAAAQIKQCTEARVYWGLLRQKHSRSSWARKAAKKDQQLKRNAKNPRKCRR